MKRILLIGTLLLTGCGEDNSQAYSDVDALIQQFANDARDYGNSVNVSHVTTEFYVNQVEISIGGNSLGSLRGECVIGANGEPHVKLEEKWWNQYSQLEKEKLMYHELGHCILGRGHTQNKLSLMYPSLNFVIYNEQTRDALLNELFHGGAQ